MSEKRRVLVFTDWFPPGFRAGGPIQSTANAVAALCDDFDVSVVTSDRDLGAVAPYPDIPAGTWVTYAAAASVMYLPPEQRSFAAIGKLLADAQPDCLYLNSMFSRSFTIHPLTHLWRGTTHARCVLAPRGMLHPGAMQFRTLRKRMFLALLRASGLTSRITFQATDEQEKKDVIRELHIPELRVVIVPNLSAAPADRFQPLVKVTGSLRALFLSRISAKKNLKLVIEQLTAVPPGQSAHLTIAGPVEDRDYLQHCRALAARLPANITVDEKGAVPHEQVRSLIEAHHVVVLPTFGENFGHVIVEAFAAGRPVIVSDQTPWRNLLQSGVGWDIPLTQPSAFGAALLAMARMDQVAFDAMCNAALTYAKVQAGDDELRRSYVDLFSNR